MFYYISINSWNLLESFISESISPFSFYQVRGYGNNLSRYIDGTNERVNYLILSTKEIEGDYIIGKTKCERYKKRNAIIRV